MEQTVAAVRAAETVLEKKEKFETAIRDGVADLSNLIISRVETERIFRRVEAAAAIGEPALGLEKARKVAADAQTALDQASLKLGGLRVALGAMGSSLATSHAALKLQIPIHESELIEQFSKEWTAACLLFSRTLGRRQSFEKLFGRQLQLPELNAVPADLSEFGQPHRKLDELERGLARIGHLRVAAEGRRNLIAYPGMPHQPYDPAQIYRVTATRGVDGIPAGSLVTDAIFDSGTLDVAVAVKDAYLYRDIEIDAGVVIAEKATREISAARAAEYMARLESRQYSAGDENLKKSVRISDDESYQTSQADLDKAAEKQRQIDAYEPLVTTRRDFAPNSEKIAADTRAAADERDAENAKFYAQQEQREKARARADEQAAELAKKRRAEPVKKEWPDALH